MPISDRDRVRELIERFERKGELSLPELRQFVAAASELVTDHEQMQVAIDEMAASWRDIQRQLNAIAHSVYGPRERLAPRASAHGAARPVTKAERERRRQAEMYGKPLR